MSDTSLTAIVIAGEHFMLNFNATSSAYVGVYLEPMQLRGWDWPLRYELNLSKLYSIIPVGNLHMWVSCSSLVQFYIGLKIEICHCEYGLPCRRISKKKCDVLCFWVYIYNYFDGWAKFQANTLDKDITSNKKSMNVGHTLSLFSIYSKRGVF